MTKTSGITINWTYGLFGFFAYRAKSFLEASALNDATSSSAYMLTPSVAKFPNIAYIPFTKAHPSLEP